MDQLVVTVVLAAVVLPRLLAGVYDVGARLAALVLRCGPVARLAKLREEVAAGSARVRKLRAEVNELEIRVGAPVCAFCATEVSADAEKCGSCGRPNAAFLGWRP